MEKNMDKIKALYIKYKDVILYLIFGVLTTVINYVSYFWLSDSGIFNDKINTVASTIIAWILAVIFAYITNKIWVFESKAKGLKANLVEIGAFLSCRILTGLMDTAIMFLCVDLLGMNDMIIKLASNVLVVIVNYIGSKLVIFKNKKED